MRTRVIVATIVGLAAAVAAGFGTYGMVSLGSCEASGSCAVPIGGVIAAFGGGLVAGIIATMAGGGLVTMGAIFAAVGAGAVVAAAQGNPAGWILGCVFLLVGLAILAGGLYARRAAARARDLQASGRPGVAIVMSVADTGATVNQSPLASLALRVEPADGSAPFEAKATKLVSRVAPPRPGDRFAVRFDPVNRADVVLGDQLPAVAPAIVSAPAPASAPGGDGLVEQLAKLDELRRSGALTAAEFDAAKARLLGG